MDPKHKNGNENLLSVTSVLKINPRVNTQKPHLVKKKKKKKKKKKSFFLKEKLRKNKKMET